ncbi:wings apart-like protein homolog isoform X2 [Pseudophryne corroboree]|uniref:wings apart-like protein homolog isoform X2 n=1 Tax=Pseudophryne corroboree TaxID=495146 RepID=UPI0030818FA6
MLAAHSVCLQVHLICILFKLGRYKGKLGRHLWRIREYETGFNMTSRFGKTYSRKGGNGNSKFDEVFSNKRTTLSTKWGETTFVAKVSQKRQNHKPEVADIPKRARVEDDNLTEDPFGFDSDEESKPISSKNVSQPKSTAPLSSERLGGSGSENFSPVVETNSKTDHTISAETTVSYKFISMDGSLHGLKEKNANKLTEDGKRLHSSPKKNNTGNVQNLIEDKNSFIAPKKTDNDSKKSVDTLHFGFSTKSCNSSKKHVEPFISDFTTETDDWEFDTVKRLDSPVQDDQTRSVQNLVLYDWDEMNPEDSEIPDLDFSLEGSSPSEPKLEDDSLILTKEQMDSLEEQMSEDVLQGGVKLSNCRTYCRSTKAKSTQGSLNFDKVLDGSSYTSSKSNSTTEKGNTMNKSSGTRTTGRTRDYTVLHPSCLSVCNVTIQDGMDRSIDEFATNQSTDIGEAGRLRKKADLATAKTTTRFRPGNTKSKKDAKLEFFGFDDQEGIGEDGGSKPFGQSSYRIKYFGFDDLSESDDEDEDDWHQKERKAQKKAKCTTASSESSALRSGVATNVQNIQSTNNMESLEDLYAVPEVFKKPASRHGDKSKDGGRKIFSGPKRSPTKAVYNARHWNQPESEELPALPALKAQSAPAKPSEAPCPKDDGVFKAPAPPPKVIKTVTIPTQPYQDIVTALKCRKEHKELYTVVQHVKHFNDVVEFGENQEFTDDIEYLLSGLKSNQPINTRCLSVISLATKCAMPSFRMHLRAHGMVAMVFKTLDDSQHHQNLALCTAALMYILSRDRLNMDLDRASLDLMIRLLEMEQDTTSRYMNEKDMNKIKEKIRKLCETVHNKHLDLENITTGHLAMETLLSLTSKRAGDWFKEELRLLGGLDHIVDKVKECANHLDDNDENEEKLVAYLWGAERCLRVLESVTVHNPENQSYLIAYKDSQLIVASAKALRHCEEFIQKYNRAEDSICIPHDKPLPYHNAGSNVGKAVEDCMRAIIGVLLNLTNDNEWGSTKTGEQDNLINTALNCVLLVPKYLPQEQRFDIRVLGLGLLINLVEYSARNRHCLVNMETIQSYDSFTGEGEECVRETSQLDAVHALVQLFLEREQAALLAESQTDELIKEVPAAPQDKSGEWQETGGEIQWVTTEQIPNSEEPEKEPEKKEEEDEELDLNKALQHAGKHMEDCIVASYTALLLGCLCQESPMNVTTVRSHLPDGDFSIMTEMLKKFLSFMNLTCAVGTTGQKSISRVIEYLEHC